MVNVTNATAIQTSAAGCGNWKIYSVGTPYCKKQNCGFLWLNSQTNYQQKKYKRTCVSKNNKITTEYKNSLEKLGCC